MPRAKGKRRETSKASRKSNALNGAVRKRRIAQKGLQLQDNSALNDNFAVAASSEVAEFIGDLSAELKSQASGAELHFLAYLLHLACQEAKDAARDRRLAIAESAKPGAAGRF